MGFLHDGHLSLVRRSVKENGLTAASIFVNPLQFGPKEDFRRYPRDLGRDKALLAQAKTDILFLPSAEDFYPNDFQTSVSVASLSRPLCGVSRPKHFAGVATVVLKLLNVVAPDVMYLGQKDFQQCRVLEQMAEDLNLSVTIKRGETVREPDGLAMSSRNTLLSALERAEAPILYQALRQCAEEAKKGERNASKLQKNLKKSLAKARLGRVDYAEIVDAKSLERVVKLPKDKPVLAAVAVYFGRTRLIDNLLIKV